MAPLLAQDPDLWCVDETTIRLETTLRRVVAPKGTKPVVRIRRGKAGVHLLGALRKSGQFLLMITLLTPDQHLIKRFLRRIKRFKGKGRLYIVWDSTGEHVAHTVQQTARKLGIHLIPQPAYAPEVQPVEEIWHQLKAYLANFLFAAVEAIIEVCQRFFAERGYRFELEMVHYFI